MKRAIFLILVVLFVVVWPVQGQTPITALEYVTRGYERIAKRDYDGAIADYTKAIELNPRLAEAYNKRGNARDAKGDHDGAITDYTKAIELNPHYAAAYLNRGYARGEKGDHDGAIADDTKAIELNPLQDAGNITLCADEYRNRGLARDAKGDHDGAIADYTKAIELFREDAPAYRSRGLAKLRQGRDREAQQDFDAAIKIDPGVKTGLERAINDIKQSRATQATPAQQKVIKDPAEYNAYMAASNLTSTVQKAAAMEGFINKYPDSVVKIDALEQMMAAYQQAAEATKVQETANRILQLDPNRVRALAIVAFMKRAQATASGDAREAAEAGAYGERGLKALADLTKPEGLSDADFGTLKNQVAVIFNGAVGYSTFQAHDYVRARQYLLKSVQLSDLNNTGDLYLLGGADLETSPSDADGFWYLAKAINTARSQKNQEAVKGIETYGKAKYHNYHGTDDGWDKIVDAAANQPAPPADFARSITPASTAAEIAVKAVKENDPATLSFSDWEYVLSFRDASPANKQAAERVWQVIRESLEKNGTVKLKIPVKVISATRGTIEAAITDENIQANKVDLEVTMEGPMPMPPAPGSQIEIIGVLTEYRLKPFMFVMKQGKLP